MPSVDELVENARKALIEFERLDQLQVDHIVARAASAVLLRRTDLAALAVADTGRGVLEDKAVKNQFACEHVTHHMRGVRTVGVIRHDELEGVTEIAAPVGVVCAVTPVTNPTSTVIYKSLIALKTRNPVIFSFHHDALECSAEAARVVYEAALEAGAPEHCLQWLGEPGRATTAELMRHKDVALILATGGTGLVRAAYSAGKPAIGVGPGNVPVYVDSEADLGQALHDVVLSKAFDHGMICGSEQNLILHEAVADAALARLASLGAHRASPEEVRLLERYVFGVESGAVSEPRISRDAVGRSAAEIAAGAGFKVPEDTLVILAEVPGIGPDQPLTREKLCPVLSVVRAANRGHAVKLAERSLEMDGRGHSVAVHSRDRAVAERFGELHTSRVLWNTPASHGAMGSMYNGLAPTFTVACGPWGGNAQTGNIQAEHLIAVKRIAARRRNMQWFKVPPRIYFEPGSLRYLSEMDDPGRVTIVAGASARRRGHVGRVLDALSRRAERVEVDVFDEVEPDPGDATIHRGAERLRRFGTGTIIAIGGGSAMDAAKLMWLLYEHPEADLSELSALFLDIRKRTNRFPKLGTRAQLVCVATTAGSGSEVSPFAVLTDAASGRKLPLGDYALTPSVAICDPTLTTELPPAVTTDSGFDALTHAIEAYVSVYANDFTDGLCLKAMQLIADNLERAVLNGSADPEARERLINAAAIAGMAFSNAFLGAVHAMSHTIGATFGIAHGRANAILLPHVIRHNGSLPAKLNGWPKYSEHTAPDRYRDLARTLGLPAKDVPEGVASLATAIEALREKVGIERSFADAGIEERTFMEALPQQAFNAFNDQCAPANPRMPMIRDLERMLRDAYYGA